MDTNIIICDDGGAAVAAEEYNKLQDLLSGKPNPEVWPPAGWQVHPQNPALLFRVVSAEVLRAELFGCPEKTEWEREAKSRIAALRDALISYFFPKAKAEGTQRTEKAGFVSMLKTGLSRDIDQTALPEVIAECDKAGRKISRNWDTDSKVIRWKASLDLKEFKKLPEEIRAKLAGAIVETPTRPVLELVKLPE